MHTQALIIHKKDVELDDVMHPYQEIDKYLNDRIIDERCTFRLIIPEEEIESALKRIREHFQKRKQENLEILQYRSTHTFKECTDKYDKITNNLFPYYKYCCKTLMEYERVKDMECSNPEQIRFIKDLYDWVDGGEYVDLYVEGVGYGQLDNPYSLWDFWTIVNEHRFPTYADFLVSQDDGTGNVMSLDDLDVDKTVEKIEGWTYVWEYVFFCKDDAYDSIVYTTDTCLNSSMSDRFQRVHSLKKVLKDIQKQYTGEGYIVSAIDFHF